MQNINSMLVLIIVSFALMGVGFSFREQQWGIGVLALGVLSMLSTLFYKLYIAFG